MKKLLLISDKLANYSAGTPRQINWILSFIHNNFEVSVFNFSNSTFTVFKTEIELRDHYNILTSQKEKHQKLKGNRHIKIFRKIKHLFFLDIFPITIRNLFIANKYIISNSIDCILASSPSPKNLIYGYLLKKSKIKLILDFRDQWYKHPLMPYSSSKVRKLIERIICQKANHIVTISNYVKENLEVHDRPVYLLYNTIAYFNLQEQTILKKEKKGVDSSKIKISHTGNLPSNFFNLKGFKDYLKYLKYAFQQNVEINIAGKNEELENLIPNDSQINFLDVIPKSEATILQSQSDFVLFIGANFHRNAGVITTKIWEYLNLKKPIIVYDVKHDSDIHKILKKFCEKRQIGKNNNITCFYPKDFEMRTLYDQFENYIYSQIVKN